MRAGLCWLSDCGHGLNHTRQIGLKAQLALPLSLRQQVANTEHTPSHLPCVAYPLFSLSLSLPLSVCLSVCLSLPLPHTLTPDARFPSPSLLPSLSLLPSFASSLPFSFPPPTFPLAHSHFPPLPTPFFSFPPLYLPPSYAP